MKLMIKKFCDIISHKFSNSNKMPPASASDLTHIFSRDFEQKT